MKKRIFGMAFLLCLLALLFVLPSMATDFVGYTAIGMPEELLALMKNPDAWGEKYYLTDDIILPADSAQSPIGTSATTPFKGVFDGNGHTIGGVALEGTHNVALFGVVNGAAIENLTVEGSVTATGNNVGGIVGFAYMNCTIRNCTADVAVSGTSGEGTGGVVGKVGGAAVGTFTLEGCTNLGEVNGKLYTGGIIGLDQHSGADSTTKIIGCKNYGKVTATSSCTAGVLGYYFVAVPGSFELSQCANYGKVHGVAYTGGVLGAHINAGKADTYAIRSTLSELYNRGDVSGSAGTTGGIIGSFQTTSAAGSMTLCDMMHAGVSASLSLVGKVNGTAPITFARLYNSVGSGIVATTADNIALESCVAADGDASSLVGDAWTRTKSGIRLTAFCGTVGQLEVVYMRDGGIGDGSTPRLACGSLADAYEALDLSKDCTIVICGSFTQSKAFNYGEAYTGSVTVTGVYGGVDYREENEAELHVGEVRFVCCGDTRFENIRIHATGKWWYLIASHNPLTMGEGIEVTGEYLVGTTFSTSIAILGGYQAGVGNPPLTDNKDVNITLLSGDFYYVIPYNRGMAGTYMGTANIYIGGDAVVATLHGSAADDGSSVGDVHVTLADSAAIITFYGSTQNMTENSFTLNWISGSIGTWDWDCPATAKKHITYTEGTTLYSLSAAHKESNFAEIAEKFDRALPYAKWCLSHGGHDFADGTCTVCGDVQKIDKLAVVLDEDSVVLLATVDSLDYASVGFTVSANGVTKRVTGLTTVYRNVVVGGKTYSADNFTSGSYIAACILDGLPTTDVTFDLITYTEAES